MRVFTKEDMCALSGRIYLWIEYFGSPGEEYKDIGYLADYIETKHGKIDREVLFDKDLNCWGYRVLIIKSKTTGDS